MEKADNVDVVLGQDFGWSDLGTWGSLMTKCKEREWRNVYFGDKSRTMTHSINVMMPKDKLAVIQGLA